MRHCSRLPHGAQAPAAARQKVRALGAAWSENQLEAALLATSEIVTDAVRHGPGPLELAVELSSARPPDDTGRGSTEVLRVEVYVAGPPSSWPDGSGWTVSAGRAGEEVDGPRSGGPGARAHRLVVTPAVTHRWGVQAGPGTATWFELHRLG